MGENVLPVEKKFIKFQNVGNITLTVLILTNNSWEKKNFSLTTTEDDFSFEQKLKNRISNSLQISK